MCPIQQKLRLPLLFVLAFVVGYFLVSSAFAGDYQIEQHALGSGDFKTPGHQSSKQMFGSNGYSDGIYFTPQYMPGYPTSATIWPRVVEVPCIRRDGKLLCEGYDWKPGDGRGEYLMFRPKLSQEQPTKPRVVYVEVPVKKKAE